MNRATQLARGAATASVALFLAALSHGVAGREAPGGVGLALAAMVALAASVAFVGRRSTPVRTALAVVASQAAFHVLFGVGAGGGARLVVNGTGHHQTVTVFEGTATSHAAHAAHAAHTDAPMLVGHAIAAVLTIVYLLAIEAAAWRSLAIAVRRFAVQLTSGIAPVPAPLVIPRGAAPAVNARPRERLLLPGLRYRGPPALLASA
ncbi:hypothetical protein [Agromyces albus]|uniref:hypothetical protein n=1 Tax=Agromyces albus TaxID=205332 RepID=UPI0027813C23|nr:hypothetical protein [Agromyces albus]MDQ0576892.1 hypothetical protein [Agromyces albus]